MHQEESNDLANFLGFFEFDLSDKFNNPLESISLESQVQTLVCIGYSNMNENRKNMVEFVESHRKLINTNWISQKAYLGSDVLIGYANIILPFAILEPSVKILNGNVFWFRSHVAHNSKISNFCWIAAGNTVGANCKIGNNCFFGVSSTIPSGSEIENYVLLTAGATSYTKVLENTVIENKLSNLPKDLIVNNKYNMVKSKDYIRFL